MAVASLRPGDAGQPTSPRCCRPARSAWTNFAEAWTSGHFPLWYLNTMLLCGGILAVQCVTVSLAGYAFARLRFRWPRHAVPPVPAATDAGAADPDRAKHDDAGRAASLRHAARRHGALFRLGVRRVPDAPDLPQIPRDYRGSGAGRRRVVRLRSSSACCCRWRGPGWWRSRSCRSPRIGTSSSGR